LTSAHVTGSHVTNAHTTSTHVTGSRVNNAHVTSTHVTSVRTSVQFESNATTGDSHYPNTNGHMITGAMTTAQNTQTTMVGGNMNKHSHLYPAHSNIKHTSGNKLSYDIMNFNCFGMKSSFNMIINQMKSVECMFLCETWLKPSDLATIRNELKQQGYWSMMKSSIDPEVVLEGRPYGGVGFICKRIPGVSYVTIYTDNDRLCALQIKSNSKVLLTIIGVYMPYYNGSVAHIQEYIDTLEDIQCIIDTNDPCPVMVLGDMNVSLPQGAQLSRHWYKSRPHNRCSLLLYDFMCHNDMLCGNFNFRQPINHTFYKNGCKSYIDHVLLSSYASNQMKDCHIMSDIADNVSDHFPMKTTMVLNVHAPTSIGPPRARTPEFPRLDWSNKVLCDQYARTLKTMCDDFPDISMDVVQDVNSAKFYVNTICEHVESVVHKATDQSQGDSHSRPLRGRRKKHWWNTDCVTSRDRQRFWHKLWVSCGRPTEGHVHECYKLAKKAYRKICRTSINNSTQKVFTLLDQYHGARRMKKFWNIVRRQKNTSNTSHDDISLERLENHFRDKFVSPEMNNNNMVESEETVKRAYDNKKHRVYEDYVIHLRELLNYVNKLRTGCAPGIDGITAEHILWGKDTRLINILCNMLTICFRYGIVPDSSTKGLLIPLLKKPNSDSTIPKNYRPIVISTTISKLIEIHILQQCGEHEFHDLQFGFVPSRSTTMAAALTHDVFDYCIHKGSPVYICSLDAESAFDGIPHSILFRNAMDIIPFLYWRVLVYWYSTLVVYIKWNNELSDAIAICKGTRQGGLSSPFLFNLLYQDMVDEISKMTTGISINNVTYNIFCYADDLLLCSLSISGL